MSAVPVCVESRPLSSPPGAPVVLCDAEYGKVVLQQGVTSALGSQLDEGFRLAPRGGVEMGGLLVGTCGENGHILVEEIVPVAIEYKFGPSFRLSEADANALRHAVDSAVQSGKRELVGVYRSQCRGVSELRPSDNEFLESIGTIHVAAPLNLRTFLLLQRQSKTHFLSTAHVYSGGSWNSSPEVVIRHGGLTGIIEFQDESMPAPLPVRVRPAALQTAGTAASMPAAPLSSQTASAPADLYDNAGSDNPTEDGAIDFEPPQENVQPASSGALVAGDFQDEGTRSAEIAPRTIFAPTEAPASRHSIGLYAVGALLLIVVLGAAYALFPAAKSPQTPVIVQGGPNQSNLGFAAVRQRSGWKLTWRRAPIFALEPSGATLAIRDGGSDQRIALGLDELAIGSIVYTPHSGDVSFVLEVTVTGKPSATERVRVLEPGFKPEP